MPKKPLDENSCFHVCVDSVIDLATKAINPKRVLGNRKLSTEQFREFVKMSEITWLELSYVFRLDALQVPKCLAAVDLEDKVHQQFLEVLTIYGMGYSCREMPGLFNMWMRQERESMGYLSPLSLLSTPMGRKMVSDWIKKELWTGGGRHLPLAGRRAEGDRA
ncbi:hypothetical protein [Chitinophaga rhizosphaerae]|uniref:hypothetical protein n=1 Tax=Chitinophaga rhizosphaerae TaxID=1864947 RepID=UPI000F8086DD|nr:hypothetical protein [Chitinophaga rhizosphaerae]